MYFSKVWILNAIETAYDHYIMRFQQVWGFYYT